MNNLSLWRSFYGERDPIAYLLRQNDTDFWLRVHSLPESKRYAQNEAETREILRRHHLLASEVLADDACILFFPSYASKKFSALFRGFNSEIFASYIEPEITLCAALTQWKTGAFDEILRCAANDEFRYISFLNTRSGEIFAPYDGGADLFLMSATRRDTLRARFHNWLSSHPQGV